jgi:hypothetical protein
MTCPYGSLACVGVVLALAAANHAKAQAWVLPRGEGDVGVTYQAIDNTGHRRTNGFLARVGRSEDMSGHLEAEYAFTDRFSVTAGLPYVFAKYTDPNPPKYPIPFLPNDQCRCWQSGWQDFGVTARYNLIGGAASPFALTPSVSLGAPATTITLEARRLWGATSAKNASPSMRASGWMRFPEILLCREVIPTRLSKK